MKPTVYEGDQPYIFVSYAHKDTDRVFPVLHALDKKGYRLWYDDGIAPGSEWPEDIAAHLNDAAMVMAFITPNSMASQNCRREINFSLSKDKPFLSVFLEKVDLPLGMEMQLSAQQSVLRYNFTNDEDFIAKILKTPNIGPCRKIAAEAENMTADDPALGLETIVLPEQPQKDSKPAEKKIKAAKIKKENKSRKRLIIPAVIAIAALLSFLVLILNPKHETSWGDSFARSQNSITVSNQTILQKDLKLISKLKKLENLTLKDCDFSECDFKQVTLPASVSKIDFSGSTGIDDFSFLNSMHLKQLKLDGLSEFNDLSAIDLSKLQILSINNTSVSDLSVFSEPLVLNELYASGTKISDLAPVSSLEKLTALDISYSNVTSLMPIASLENLNSLNISGCTLKEIPDGLMSLKLSKLFAASCSLQNLNLAANCTILKAVNLSNNPELNSLGTLITQNRNMLEELNLSFTSLDDESLSQLGECTGLQGLALDGIKLSNLDFCEKMPNLEWIYARNCGLSDIGGLASSTSLNTVALSFNDISNVQGLRSINPNNANVDLSFNSLENISSLPSGKYRILMLHGNNSSVLNTLPSGAEGYMITAAYSDELLNSQFTSSNFYSVYVTDVPANQVLNLENAIDSLTVDFMSEEELVNAIAANQLQYSIDVDYSYSLNLYNSMMH